MSCCAVTKSAQVLPFRRNGRSLWLRTLQMTKLTLSQLLRPPLPRLRRPARKYGRVGVQGIHFRHAVPEAVERPFDQEREISSRRTSRPRVWPRGDREAARQSGKYTFFVPDEAHWSKIRHLKTDVGTGLNKALDALEDANVDTLAGRAQGYQLQPQNRPTTLMTTRFRIHSEFRRNPAARREFEFPDLLGAAYEYLIKFFADWRQEGRRVLYSGRRCPDAGRRSSIRSRA